jgi:hypothetical protein
VAKRHATGSRTRRSRPRKRKRTKRPNLRSSQRLLHLRPTLRTLVRPVDPPVRLESPDRHRVRERLQPSKLFSGSSRRWQVELRASALNRKVSFGNHRCFIYGSRIDRGKPPDADRTCSGTSNIQNSEITEVWNYSPWYYHADSLVNTVDDRTRELFRAFRTHGNIWTGACDNAVHRSQRLSVKPMKSSDWPRDPLGPSWPSFPTITEWLEMLRRGIDPFERKEYKIPSGDSGYTRVSRGELHSNCVLATRIVSNVIVGIRSSTEVPGKYLPYFRYGHGVLLLACSYALPIGLVRFLLGRWCVAPYSLWLRRQCTLKQYLRKVPISLVKQARLRLDDYAVSALSTRAGTCTYPADDDSEYYSGGSSELD